jgi:MFS superfamily sulfate permease-like transporter
VSTLSKWLPGVRMLASYRASWLKSDVVAGLVLTTLLVPQGMAYAELAGLPAITGLYTSALCLIGYALFGPSRILVLGPDSSLGPMIAAAIIPIIGSNGDPARAIELASMLALLVGGLMIIAGVARLGFIADLLSKPTQIGYMNGLALTILISQLPKLCGFSVDGDKMIDEARGFVDGVTSGEVVAPRWPLACWVSRSFSCCSISSPRCQVCWWPWWPRSRRRRPSTCRATAFPSWGRCRRAFRRSRCRPRSPTCRC